MATNLATIEHDFFKKFLDKDQNHPSIDLNVDLNNITKYTKYDELFRGLENIIKTQPEKFKFFLDEIGNPFYEKTFKYADKNSYKRNNFFDNKGDFIIFQEDMIMYPITEFGNYSEDAYKASVFVDGKKIYETDYEIHTALEGKRLYIKSSKLKKDSEVLFTVERVYQNDKMHFHVVDNVAPANLKKVDFVMNEDGKTISQIKLSFLDKISNITFYNDKWSDFKIVWKEGNIDKENSTVTLNPENISTDGLEFTLGFNPSFGLTKERYDGNPLYAKMLLDSGEVFEFKIPTFINSQLNGTTYRVPLSEVGERHYSLDNFVLFLRKKNTSYFKHMKKERDYAVLYDEKDGKSLFVTVSGNVRLRKGDIFCLVNKLSYSNIRQTLNVATPEIKLSYKEGDFNFPLPFENLDEIDLWLNGYHLTPEVNYTLNWNENDPNKPPMISFNLPVPKNSFLEIECNTDYTDRYNYRKYQQIINKYGFVDFLKTNVPVDNGYSTFYLDNRRIPRENIEAIGNCLFRFKDIKTVTNLDVRSRIPSYHILDKMCEYYKFNKNDLTSYIEAIGLDDFIDRYVTKNDIEEIETPKSPLYAIELRSNKTLTFKNYYDVEFRVIATYNDGTSKDVTEDSFVTPLDTSTIGIKTVRATYVEEGVIKSAEIDILVTEYTELKDLYALQIYTDRELSSKVDGSDVKVTVVATYTNSTFEDVTDKCNLKRIVENGEITFIAEMKDANGDILKATKKVRIRQLIPSDLNRIVLTADKYEIYSNEEIVFNVVAIYNDESSRNVSPYAEITGFRPDIYGMQTIRATYIEDGITAWDEIEIKVLEGKSDVVAPGIQKIVRPNIDGTQVYIAKDEYEIEQLFVKFPVDVTNSLIMIKGLFPQYNQVKNDTITLPTDFRLNQEDANKGLIQVISWENIIKDYTLMPVENRKNYLLFSKTVSKNSFLFYKGIVYDFDINPTNNKEIKIRDVNNNVNIDHEQVMLISFKTNKGVPVSVGRDYGKVNNLSREVMFAQDVNDFLVFYNGYIHEYSVVENRPKDISYRNGDLSFVDPKAKVVAMAIYTGLTPIGRYTDKRLEEIDNRFKRSYDKMVVRYEDFIQVEEDGQQIFYLKHTPVSDDIAVYINGVMYSRDDINSKNWILDRRNKKLIWTYTPANYPDSGFDIERGFDFIAVYDYIHESEVID